MRTRPLVLAIVAMVVVVVATLWAFGRFVVNHNAPIFTGLFLDGLMIGVLSMATIQGVRFFVPVRALFHRAALEGHLWKLGLAEHLGRKGQELDTAFYDLPAEQLFGQLGVAVEAVVIERARQAEGAGSGSSWRHEFDRIVDSVPESSRNLVREALEFWDSRTADRDLRDQASADASLRRQLDALQIDVAFRWRRYVRAAAFGVSAALALAWQLGSGGLRPGAAVAALAVALLGGFVATVSRDVVALIEKARR